MSAFDSYSIYVKPCTDKPFESIGTINQDESVSKGLLTHPYNLFQRYRKEESRAFAFFGLEP